LLLLGNRSKRVGCRSVAAPIAALITLLAAPAWMPTLRVVPSQAAQAGSTLPAAPRMRRAAIAPSADFPASAETTADPVAASAAAQADLK